MENIGNISLTTSSTKLSKKKDELVSQAVQLIENVITNADIDTMWCFANSPSVFNIKDTVEFVKLRMIASSNFWTFYCEDEFNRILKNAGWRYDFMGGLLYVEK